MDLDFIHQEISLDRYCPSLIDYIEYNDYI